MTIHTALAKLAQLEERLSELYAWLADVFTGNFDASGLFSQLFCYQSLNICRRQI